MVQKCWELLDSNSKMVFTHSPITKGRYRAAKNLVMITMVQLFSPCPPWIYFPFKCKIEAADGLAFPRLIRDSILHTTNSWSPNSTDLYFSSLFVELAVATNICYMTYLSTDKYKRHSRAICYTTYRSVFVLLWQTQLGTCWAWDYHYIHGLIHPPSDQTAVNAREH